ncbi:MAG: NAD-dependent epimerase/dehydratase family protein, partial [Pirellulaceae bacterium]
MTTLVTGATGLVGNNVVRVLLNAGEAVRVLCRPASDPRPLAGLEAEIVAGDICDAESVRRATEGVSQVVHAAGKVHIGWSGLESQRAINVEGTRNVAVAAREVNAKMIHVSSVDALGVGSPELPADEDSAREGKVPCCYVVTKREAEEVFLDEVARGLDGVVVNPGLMFGPWDWKPSSGRMLLEVARRMTPFAPKGGGSVCDVRDVAAGILAALQRGVAGRRYILAGENLTYLDLWKRMAQVTGGSAPICRAGPLMRIMAGRSGDLLGKLTGREPDVNSAAVGMSNLYHYYSIA